MKKVVAGFMLSVFTILAITTGCDVSDEGTDWVGVGDNLAAQSQTNALDSNSLVSLYGTNLYYRDTNGTYQPVDTY